jgi:DNA-binding NtrC family response regulator
MGVVLHTTNILLVDDDLVVRQSLEHALTRENFKVFSAANRQEALRGFGENRIDVALLALSPRPDSGWDTFQSLRQLQPRLPVVLMTGQPGQGAARKSDSIEAFMEKPLDLEELFRTLKEFAGYRQEPRAEQNGTSRHSVGQAKAA